MNPTSPSHISGRSTAGRHLTIIVGLFLSVLLGLVVFTTSTIHQEKSYAILIDMAGRQRMLLQQHLNEILLTSQGIKSNYAETRAQIVSTLHALMEGGTVVVDPEKGQTQIIAAVPTKGMVVKLGEQRNGFDQIVAIAEDFLLVSSDHPDFSRKLQSLRTLNSTVIGIADDVVKQLDTYSNDNLTTMMKWEIFIGFCMGLFGVVVIGQGIRNTKRLENEIAERQRAESALRNSEIFLNSIVENLPHMIFVKDATNLRFVLFNKAGEKLLGYPRQAMIGKTDYDFFPESEADFYTSKDKEVLKGKVLLDIPEEIIHTKSHGLRYLHTKKIPILDAGGHPRYLLGISEDITERKTSEERTKQLFQQNELILASAGDGIYGLDLAGRTTFVNPAAAKMLGYEPHELVGTFMHATVHHSYPDGTPYPREKCPMYAAFTDGNTYKIEDDVLWRKDGTSFPIEYSSTPIWQGEKLTGAVVTFRDITERKQAETTLRATEEMYRQILDSISDMIFVKDRNFRIVWANKSFRSYYNMTNEELRGILDAEFNEPEFTRQYIEDDAYVLNTGKILDIPEEPVTRHDGKIHLFHTIKAPLFGENQEVMKLVGVARDITERKQAEEVFRKGERKFRAIYEQAPSGIAVLNSLNGQFTQINQKYCDITGYSQEEMLNRTFQELTHPDDLQADLDQMQKLLAGEISHFQIEKRYIRKNGDVIWVNLTCVPLWLEPTDVRQHIAMVEDISYRKQSEKAIQESEERYRALYENNPSMYFTVGKNGKVLSVNEFGAQQLGYAVEELIGQPVIKLFFDDDRARVQERFEDCLQSPLTVFTWEFRKVRKDRSVLWVKEVARSVHNKDGEIVVLIVCEDISERKATEKALQEWKALTESILGQLPKGFAYRCLNDKTWTAVYVSDGIEDVTGVPVSDFLSGRTTYDTLMAPGENERVWPMVQDALAKQLPYENEHQIITRDGTKKWILARGRFIFDEAGNLLHMDGLNVDITEHKHIEAELRTSEARFRSLVDHVPFCIYEIGLDGRVSSINRAGQKMVGAEDELQVLGRSYLHLEEGGDVESLKENFLQAVQGQPVDFEFKVTSSEKVRVFWKSFIPVRGRNGEVLKVVGVTDEITERKQAEERLRESEAKRIEALSESDALKSALLSSVSHELRTPLTAMKSSVSNLMDSVSNSREPMQHEFLHGIDQEIDYMSQLVNNLLNMSQIEAGTLVPHREWHPLEDLVEGALRRAGLTIDTRNIEIQFPDEVPPVFVDAVEMQQVLINLLDNAVKYSFPESKIGIHVRVGDQRIEVEVSNEGEPIPEQDLERIFERFYRHRVSRQHPVRGTGLGLAICKGIVEAHGGRIWAQSIGAEMKITFTVPLTESMASFTLEGLQKT